ncbi:hypothetical protein GCM10009651_34760 [Microbacterium natoriense]
MGDDGAPHVREENALSDGEMTREPQPEREISSRQEEKVLCVEGPRRLRVRGA